MDQAATESLRKAQPPTTKSEMKSFLGMTGVVRRFVDKYTEISGPLNELLKKDAPPKFELNETQLESFNKLIEACTTAPVLALPRVGLQYSVDTDASAYGVGAALYQTHEDGERMQIGFWSRSLTPAEKNYSPTERECLAVVWALKVLRPYLLFE